LCATTYRWRRGRSRVRDRPLVLKRFVDGAEGEAFYQKRAPENRPSWLRTVTLSFPSGRTAEEIVVDNAGGLAWTVNLGCIELHPHPVRSGDLEHPDELRVDLDPSPASHGGAGRFRTTSSAFLPPRDGGAFADLFRTSFGVNGETSSLTSL
jgi:hypothetical protein